MLVRGAIIFMGPLYLAGGAPYRLFAQCCVPRFPCQIHGFSSSLTVGSTGNLKLMEMFMGSLHTDKYSHLRER